MNRSVDTDRLVATWIGEQFSDREPTELLDRVLDVTSRRRPRPAWLGRLAGHHLSSTTALPGAIRPWKDRPMNRTLPLIAGLAAIAIAVAVGVSALMPRAQQGAGASGVVTTVAPSAGARPASEMGALGAGVYAATSFLPGLRLEVPAGWDNVSDNASTFVLHGPGPAGVLCLDGNDPGSCRHPENVITLTTHRALGVDANDCEGLRQQGGPTSAAGMMAALASDPRLKISGGRAVTIGGLTGSAVVIELAPNWSGTCKWSDGAPAALILTAAVPPGPFLGLRGRESIDLILLDSSEGVISIDSDPLVRASAQPVIQTFVFGGSGPT